MSMHKTRTRVDKEGVPHIIQKVKAGSPMVLTFNLFNGECLVLTHELVEDRMFPLPEFFIYNLVMVEDYNSINELLADWIWKMIHKTGDY